MPGRDEIVLEYLDKLLYPPYPVQEEALFAWGECDQGVLLSAPTGTGKTLVAEAAVYEGLRTGKVVYYSTPLIALTDQKLVELQDTVDRWGYDRDHVGLVTGHRTVNPQAQVKVVVAEVLLNRLLHPEAFDFTDVGAVVMDEFHNFNDPQRGIVWELALSLLPPHVRVMLLSATVGAAQEFVGWMARSLDRRVTLVEGKERRVPLHFEWVGDELLPDFLEQIAAGTDDRRRTPALVFCFDREVCWATAEVLRGKDLFAEGQRKLLLDRLDDFDFSVGGGNKLRTLLARGVGVHHAGLLPRYRRVVETLFQEKLLPVCVCTETLAAGLNLPARSVVLTTLVKGPPDQAEADRHRQRPADVRPGRPAAVRRRGVRLRPGPRGRREDRPVEGQVRQHPRGHEGPRPDGGQEVAEEEAADPPGELRVLERRPVREAADGPAGQAGQPRQPHLAVARVPARGRAGRRADPHRHPPAADGPADDRGRAEAAEQDAGHAARPGRGRARPAAAAQLAGAAGDRRGDRGPVPADDSDEPVEIGDLVGRLKLGGAAPAAVAAKAAARRPTPSRTTRSRPRPPTGCGR